MTEIVADKPNWIKRILIAIFVVPIAIIAMLIVSAVWVTRDIPDGPTNDEIVSTVQLDIGELTAQLSRGIDSPSEINSRDVKIIPNDQGFCGSASVEKRGSKYVGYRRFFMAKSPVGKTLVRVEPLKSDGREALASFNDAIARACALAYKV